MQVKIHAIFQILDGLLTYWGVSRFGIDAEGNPVLHRMMHEIGEAPTLLLTKGLILFLLYQIRNNQSIKFEIWLFLINCFYLMLALVPWTLIHIGFVSI